MSALFADTFYWIALADLTDSAHQRAMTLTAERTDSLIVTTDEVLAEYLTFFATAPEQMRRKAVTNAQRILETLGCAWCRRAGNHFWQAWPFNGSRPDEGYSLTDCSSMQTTRKEGLSEVLTNDRHFEQEGFRALFRNS